MTFLEAMNEFDKDRTPLSKRIQDSQECKDILDSNIPDVEKVKLLTEMHMKLIEQEDKEFRQFLMENNVSLF